MTWSTWPSPSSYPAYLSACICKIKAVFSQCRLVFLHVVMLSVPQNKTTSNFLEGCVSSSVSLICCCVELLGPGQGCLFFGPGSRLEVNPPHSAQGTLDFTPWLFPLPVEQNEVEAVKAAPVTNSVKAESSASMVPAASPDDSDLKKAQEKCKRLQVENSKLAEENRQLKV